MIAALLRAVGRAYRLALLEAAAPGAIARVVAPIPPRLRRAFARDLRTVGVVVACVACALVLTPAYPLSVIGALAAWLLDLADRVDA